MSRLISLLVSVLVILVFVGGCAKKPLPVEEVVSEPIAVKEPVQKEEAVVVQEPESMDPLTNAGFFTLESSALETVYFDYDSSQLSSEAMNSLKSNAEMLLADPAFKVTVEGHCDERGSDEYNLSLGELRAHTVLTYLSSLGVEQDRVTVISFGEERPAVKGSNEASWAKNRRVEFN